MEKEGAYAWLSLGGNDVLMLNDARGIEYVFKRNADNYRKSKFYNVLKPMLGQSILMSEGTIWRRQRKESSPVFAPKPIEEMIPDMVDAVESMFRRWETKDISKEGIDLNFETMFLALDVLLRTLFHEDKKEKAREMQAAIITLLREAEERVWSWFKLPQRITFLLPKYRNSLHLLNQTIHDLMVARERNQSYPEDLLSRLIKSYGSSDEERKLLRDQIMTFLLAGHETTANGLVWSCYYLSLHPEIWRKMQQEVDVVFAGQPPSAHNIKELVYCRQVFEEVLRFHPVVWTMSRDSIVHDKIPLEDGTHLDIPPNTTVMLCSYAVHRREKYWENPDAFDPERFSPDTVRKRPVFAYFPFGGGARQCLGIRFAQIESVLSLAMLVQRYNIHLKPGQAIKAIPNITLRPEGAVFFRLLSRQKIQHGVSEPFEVVQLPELTPLKSQCPFNQVAV